MIMMMCDVINITKYVIKCSYTPSYSMLTSNECVYMYHVELLTATTTVSSPLERSPDFGTC